MRDYSNLLREYCAQIYRRIFLYFENSEYKKGCYSYFLCELWNNFNIFRPLCSIIMDITLSFVGRPCRDFLTSNKLYLQLRTRMTSYNQWMWVRKIRRLSRNLVKDKRGLGGLCFFDAKVFMGFTAHFLLLGLWRFD